MVTDGDGTEVLKVMVTGLETDIHQQETGDIGSFKDVLICLFVVFIMVFAVVFTAVWFKQ